MTELAHVTDYQDRGEAQIIHDLRKPKVIALLRSWLSEAQACEDAFWALYQGMFLSGAGGDALDRIGAIVGQPRENRTDETYRLWIRARIIVLRSSGRPEELIRAALIVLPTGSRLQYVEGEAPATYTLHVEPAIGGPDGVQVARMLRLARPAAVRGYFHWYGPQPALRFAPGAEAVQDSVNGYGSGRLSAISDGSVLTYTWSM